MAQLGLGTVQFGLDYGISNDTGQVRNEDARQILDGASTAGIRYLDTARAYGTSEETLGQSIRPHESWRVVTKTPPLEAKDATPAAITEQLDLSLSALKASSVYGLLSHRSELFLSDRRRELWDTFRALKDSGRVQRIGASVYSGDEIDELMSLPELDLIQVPASIFDQRLIRSGHIERLRNAGVEIHVRSVFLQGLVFLNPAKLPAKFQPFRNDILRVHDAAEALGVSAPELALRFALERLGADVILVGVTTSAQLQQNIAWSRAGHIPLPPPAELDMLGSDNVQLTNPATW